VGEIIITLQDVAVPLGLLIDGHVVTWRDDRDLMVECERLLGKQSPQSAIRGGAVILAGL